MLQELIYAQGKKARRAARVLANLSSDKKNQVLLAIADSLETKQDRILAANEQDLASGRKRLVQSPWTGCFSCEKGSKIWPGVYGLWRFAGSVRSNRNVDTAQQDPGREGEGSSGGRNYLRLGPM